MENVQHVKNIQYVYLLTKYTKCNVCRLAVRCDVYIYVVRRLRFNVASNVATRFGSVNEPLSGYT
jgi:hypothetical protein